MQSQAGNGIRSASGAGEALQTIPRLCLGGLAVSETQGHCLKPETLPLVPGSWAWIQAVAAPLSACSSRHTGTDGKSTELAFIWGMSPPHPRKQGHYRASPCLQGWKQPQLLDTQSGTRRLLGRGQDSRPGDTVLINPPQANAGCGQAPAMNGGLSKRLF